MVGIDDVAVHIPRLFFDMADFASLRGLNAEKLRRGLGLEAMALPDVHEDPATMGANAVAELIERNELDPRSIGRIYVGTESALDGSKPTATYILDMLQQRFEPTWGEGCFRHCDVVDMTFACVGAVDALHNTLDWVRGDGRRKGIVVYTDNARYDRKSTGEYTQGAGAGAILVTHHPRILAIGDLWGVGTLPVHDFYKPRRRVSARSLFSDVLGLAQSVGGSDDPGLVDRMLQALPDSALADSVLFHDEADTLHVHCDTPRFDGPLSNRCYVEAVKHAFVHFRNQAEGTGRFVPGRDPVLTEQWERIVVHLPYAYQGRRMFPDIYRFDRQHLPEWRAMDEAIGHAPRRDEHDDEASWERAREQYRRALSKTPEFQEFVARRIERGQRASSLVGNQYTGSIFLALLSTLEADLAEGNDLTGHRIGFCGYGSGAKAKVFEGTVQQGWQRAVERIKLFERLSERVRLDAVSYEQLHHGRLRESVAAPTGEFALDRIEDDGQRVYAWVA